ncbi:hypothetical protein K469DRAFT_692103 [Zopfia rhizophila CBS 207.26]|uniref:Uncharacterized protein n=1 Tax=Zopfia rhizophila CBS 207.26 TaxID=1314779 RepID=A0A6A6DTC7_9PEZI|nr:hypothetical protein K469DRAFT_692103 [Zopfia rhizophila CBS 207.26]
MPLILAEELDTLTVQGIQEWDQRAGDGTRIFIDVIDKHNLTDERLERLKQISPRRSPTPSDTASTPITTIGGVEFTWEELTELKRISAYEKYQELKNMGGRPSREINPDPGPCPPWKSERDKEYHVSDHWGGENGRMGDETTRWLDFRWYQFKMREDPERFDKYKAAVHKHRQEKGIDWAVELQLDRQTKLDEWREYYIYEHRKRHALEKKLDRAKRELEPAKERMMEAKRNGSVGVPETVLLERAADMVMYREKISQAQKEVEMAQKRLVVLRIEESFSAAQRDMLIMQAEEDLESAQKRLEAEKSDELEQLNKEAQRENAREHLAIAQGKVNGANTRLEQLDTLLEWIVGQFAKITTEYASSSWGSQHNRELLEGWERYYVYMRKRLQEEQDRVAKRVQEGVKEWPRESEHYWIQSQKELVERKEERLKNLWAWVEREFPEIAAKYAPFSQDSQSNDDHQGKADPPYSKPSPNELARKASRSDVGKNTWRKRGSAKERSPLSQVQPSKVSKPSRRGRPPLNQKRSTTRDRVWLPKGHTNDTRQIKGREPPKVAVRRSKRISQRMFDPAPPCPTEKSSQRRPEGTLRRSTRILDSTKKIHTPGPNPDVKSARSSTTARRKSTRRTTVHTNTAYSGKPQGISKTRHWKATSKKGEIV